MELIVQLPPEEPQIVESELSHNQTEPAIKKVDEEQGICKLNSQEQGSGLSQGGEAVQSHDADIETPDIGSIDLTESREPHASDKRIQQKPPATPLEEPLQSERGGRYCGRLRYRTPSVKKYHCDHIDSELLQFSSDESTGNASRGSKRCRIGRQSSSELPSSNQANQTVNLRDRCRAEKSQTAFEGWLTKKRSQGGRNHQSPRIRYDGREAAPSALAQLQHDVSSSKEGDSVAGSRKITPGSLQSSVKRIESSCEAQKWGKTGKRGKMVTRIQSYSPGFGGTHEGAALRTPPVRKRKAGVLADEFPEANGLDALSNRRPRSDGSERQYYQQLSAEREEVVEHSGSVAAEMCNEAFINGEFDGGNRQFDELDAFVCGEFGRPGISVHDYQFYSGRETNPPHPFADRGAYIGPHSHSSQLGGRVQDRDISNTASEPSPSRSSGTPQSEARLSSDEDYHPPACYSAYNDEIDYASSPMPSSSYPSRSRRRLVFPNVPQRVGSISVLSSDPNNATQSLPNRSAEFHAIPVNQHASSSTSVVPSMNDKGLAVLNGDEDYEPEDGNLLDEEDKDEEEEEEEAVDGILDLNEFPEQQKQRSKRFRKKHRPKVFREGRPDRRRKPKNAEELVSKKKESEVKKVDGKPRGRKKRATSDLNSAQGDLLGNQGEHFMPLAANCGSTADGYVQCQGLQRISDAGRSQGRRAVRTEDSLQSRADSRFPQNEGPHTPPPLRLVNGPKNSLILADLSSPNARHCSALTISASASPSPTRKRSGEVEGHVDEDTPLRRTPTMRELFKKARSKITTAHGRDHSELAEKFQESLYAVAHPGAVSTAKTVGTRPRRRTDPRGFQELAPLNAQELSIALCDPSAMSVRCNPSNAWEGVSGESSIISVEMGMGNGSATIPEASVSQAKRGRLREAARAKCHQNGSIRIKGSYTRLPKHDINARELNLVVNRMANMDLAEIDSGLQLVPHANLNTALVAFVPMRRRKARARVMLDGEDKRIWRLLMTQGTSFEDDSTEKEAPRQWEEERATMKARAEKFINRMHLVQGDRRFSVWKGSVVDSVVGAFLTQNVSDHLSSSAFMCLAARFPVARKKKAAAECMPEATVTELQLEEAYDEISQKASGVPTFSDGGEVAQEGVMTAFQIEEALDISDQSSGIPPFSDSAEAVQDGVMAAFHVEEALDIVDMSSGISTFSDDPEAKQGVMTVVHFQEALDISDKSSGIPTVSSSAEAAFHVEEALDVSDQSSGVPTFSDVAEAVQDAQTAAFHTEEALDISDKSSGISTASDRAEAVQDGEMTAFHVEEVLDIIDRSSGIPILSNGAEAVEDCEMTASHAEEALDISEKCSATGEGSSLCCDQQSHDTSSTKLTVTATGEGSSNCCDQPVHDSMSTKLTVTATGEKSSMCCDQQGYDTVSIKWSMKAEVLEKRIGSTVQVTQWHDYAEDKFTDSREQNSSCSSKASQCQCTCREHHETSHGGDSLEVRESEEHKTGGLVEDDISYHSGPGEVLLSSSGQLNSIDSITLVEVGQGEVTDIAMPALTSWIQAESELSLVVDLSAPLPVDDMMTDIRYGRLEYANSIRTSEIGGNSTFGTSPGHHIVVSSGSVESSSGSLDANNPSQSSVTPGSDRNLLIGEEIREHTAGVIFSVESFDTNNQQLVISSAVESSEHSHQQIAVSYTTEGSPLRGLKTIMRKKGQTMTKGSRKTGQVFLKGKTNSELVNTEGDNQEKQGRGRTKRPVISLTGIARARLEQSNITSKVEFDWEAVRLKYTVGPDMGENQHESPHAGCKSFGSSDVENGVDWDAVRSAELEDIANVIKERGMNNVLAGRIKAFLERVQKEHGSVDLEWLRTVSVEEAKSFLLSVRGLGLKSVECIRLLTLHHLAFPVDTNVGRICVRLGWVPLEPLPEELQLHLLELYPVQETIQKYLWPRLCTLDQRTLYELHYQMITFGKVFCTKSRPNCNACPMRDDCQHFASALASARLALPAAPHQDSHPTNSEPPALPPPTTAADLMQKLKLALPSSEQDDVVTSEEGLVTAKLNSFILSKTLCEPIVEEPRTPEPEIADIEDFDGCVGVSSQPSGSEKGSSSEIELVVPPAEVSILHSSSKALVVLPADSASIPVPKLKNIGRLRTVHYVYELPDNHPLVQEMDPREDDDPCFYLLAIWSPGESPHAPPVLDDMYTNGTCDGFNSGEEETVKGTVLVPCRTAMRGIFPLNGTYFQVNEVFADHASSLQPIEVPRTMLWNLRRRFVYFGTSVTSIFKGLSTEEIQACFWRGYVCVRGFDSVSRCPRPLAARLHFPASKIARKPKEEKSSPSNDEDQN